ncbi:MAG: DEAD/DEAH box helicase [Saprospiraceae bacterium]|nr:DEAD/DEAH box helicase [Candidatus Opimibacter skivensis]
MKNPVDILKQYWGYSAFRPLQQEIIERVIAGEDVLALLPTGGGKSLCYQVPALALDGLTIVISPLIALMKDQVSRLKSLNIAAEAIYSQGCAMQISIGCWTMHDLEKSNCSTFLLKD